MAVAQVLLQGPDGQSDLLHFSESLGKVGDDFFMRALVVAVNLSDAKRFVSLPCVCCVPVTFLRCCGSG